MNTDILRKRLDEGEKLLWYGVPLTGGGRENKAPEPAVKSIYGAILKAIIIPVILSTVGLAVLLGVKAIIVIPSCVTTAILLMLYLRPEEWVYGITDKRVMLGTEKSGIESYSLDSISDIKLNIGKDGIGSVIFTADGAEHGLYGLKNAQQVKELLVSDKME